jgi:hypothetical protein
MSWCHLRSIVVEQLVPAVVLRGVTLILEDWRR